MSRPTNPAAYPPDMLRAVEAALDLGEFVIPTPKPAALRLTFQGLRGALRREGKSEKIDAVAFHLQAEPPALIIRARTDEPLIQDVSAALAALSRGVKTPSATEDAEAALERLLGPSNPPPVPLD